MLGLMQYHEMTVDEFLAHAERWHGATEVISRQADGGSNEPTMPPSPAAAAASHRRWWAWVFAKAPASRHWHPTRRVTSSVGTELQESARSVTPSIPGCRAISSPTSSITRKIS